MWYVLALAHHGACQFAEARECVRSGLKLVKKQLKAHPHEAAQKAAELEEVLAAVNESAANMGDDDDDDMDDGGADMEA